MLKNMSLKRKLKLNVLSLNIASTLYLHRPDIYSLISSEKYYSLKYLHKNVYVLNILYTKLFEISYTNVSIILF